MNSVTLLQRSLRDFYHHMGVNPKTKTAYRLEQAFLMGAYHNTTTIPPVVVMCLQSGRSILTLDTQDEQGS